MYTARQIIKEGDKMNENIAHCKHIAKTIEAIVDGELYRCPECGELIRAWEESEDEDGYTVYNTECGCKANDEPEPETMLDYFSDAFDIEYHIGSDRNFRSVRLMVACGGPNIYVDTCAKEVQLYWWTDRATYPISTEAADAINEDFEMLYNC